MEDNSIIQTIRSIYIFFTLVLCFLFAQPSEARYAAIVIDAKDGHVLHSTNADTLNYPASLTKLMTLLLLFESLEQNKLKMGTKLIASTKASKAQPSKLGLQPGDIITVRQAISALITKSANDVAVVVAEQLSGSVHSFARAMTRRARALGMNDTTFRNPHGLPNRGHLSTARDMALLSRVLINKFPNYYNYFATRKFHFKGRSFKTHNKLLGHYDGADGIKTGYTNAAGYNLSASAERDGKRLIAVVFGGKTAKFRDNHVKNLLNKCFAKISGSRQDDILTANAKPMHSNSPIFFADPPPTQSIAAAEARKLARQIAEDAKLPPFSKPIVNPTPRGAWMIQIGAYFKIAPATKRAGKAAAKLSKFGKNYDIAVMTAERKNRTLYRARLAGLSRKDAYDACRELKRHDFDCIPMSPTRTYRRR